MQENFFFRVTIVIISLKLNDLSSGSQFSMPLEKHTNSPPTVSGILFIQILPQHFQGYCLPSKPLKSLFPLLIAAPSARPRNYPPWPFTDRILISVLYALRTNFNFPVILGHCKFTSTSANYSIEHSCHFFSTKDYQHFQFSSQNTISRFSNTYSHHRMLKKS